MGVPEATIDHVNRLLEIVGEVAPLLGAPQLKVVVAILEALVRLLPVEPTVSQAQLSGGEEHVPGGPIHDGGCDEQ